MNETLPVLDLGAEAVGSPMQTVLVIVLALLALGWLVRRTITKRHRALSGEGCGDCAGCGTQGGACKLAPDRVFSPDCQTASDVDPCLKCAPEGGQIG